MLRGQTPSGDPITLYQFITINDTEADADGDGIPDASDPCNFIDSWYDEQSGVGICEAVAQDEPTDISIPPVVAPPVTDTKLELPETRIEIEAPQVLVPQKSASIEEGRQAVTPWFSSTPAQHG